MSCIACECYAIRVTNIFRDDDLRTKYAEVTGYKVKREIICLFVNFNSSLLNEN